MTIAMGSLEAEGLPTKKIPENYPLPVLRLGRLAVDSHYQGMGIGKQLLGHVLRVAVQQKKTVGCVGVVVDAKEEAIAFYQKFGFKVLEDVIEGVLRGSPPPHPMYLPVQSI